MSWSSWTAPHSMTEQSSRLIFIHPSNNLHPPTHWTISIHSSTHWLIFTHPSNNLHPPTHWTISTHTPTHSSIFIPHHTSLKIRYLQPHVAHADLHTRSRFGCVSQMSLLFWFINAYGTPRLQHFSCQVLNFVHFFFFFFIFSISCTSLYFLPSSKFRAIHNIFFFFFFCSVLNFTHFVISLVQFHVLRYIFGSISRTPSYLWFNFMYFVISLTQFHALHHIFAPILSSRTPSYLRPNSTHSDSVPFWGKFILLASQSQVEVSVILFFSVQNWSAILNLSLPPPFEHMAKIRHPNLSLY